MERPAEVPLTYPHRLAPPRRAQLVAEKQDILRRMRRFKAHVRHLRPEYARLVTNLQAVDRELSLIRARLHQEHCSFPQFFVQAAQVLLSHAQFMEVHDVAEQMQRDQGYAEASRLEGRLDDGQEAQAAEVDTQGPGEAGAEEG